MVGRREGGQVSCANQVERAGDRLEDRGHPGADCAGGSAVTPWEARLAIPDYSMISSETRLYIPPWICYYVLLIGMELWGVDFKV